MKTVNRSVKELDINVKNNFKFFNQMDFKGIIQDKNIFEVDQRSLYDSNNLYVDFDNTLKSRKPLQLTNLPVGILPTGNSLVQILPIGEQNVYVSVSSTGVYYVTIDGTPVTTLTNITSYHLSTVEHYVICFNEVDAKVFDVNYFAKGWQKLSDLADIPITKRIVGGQETDYPANGFTKSYKEQYIWSNQSQPSLPTTEFNKPERLTPDLIDFTAAVGIPAYNDCEVVRTSDEMITGIRINSVLYTRIGEGTFVEGTYENGNTSYHLMADKLCSINKPDGTWVFCNYLVKPGTFSEPGEIGDVPTGEVVLNYDKNKIEWTIPKTGLLTDYRILRPLNVKVEDTDLFSAAKGIICIGREDYFLISYDGGSTFDREWYPTHGLFLNVASISTDGQYFFFAANEAVYRCNLADKSWSKILIFGGNVPSENLGTDTGVNNICHFLTGDIFTFITYNRTTKRVRLFFKGPGLFQVNVAFNNMLAYTYFPSRESDPAIINLPDNRDRTSLDCDNVRLVASLNSAGDRTDILGIFPSTTVDKQRIVTVAGTSNREGAAPPASSRDFEEYGQYGAAKSAYALSERYSTGKIAAGIGALGIIYMRTYMVGGVENGPGWFNYTLETGVEKQTDGSYISFQDFVITQKLPVTSAEGYPYSLTGGWIDNLTVYDKEAIISASLPTEITTRQNIFVFGDYFYIKVGDIVYTNRLTDSDNATITYTYIVEDNKYTNVPNVSYSDTELYLATNTLLQITANIKDGTDIKFNLPAINDNSFIAPITGMINISTTEVAIFFKNKIVVCSKIKDDLLGFRYDYYNTKLSTGIRLGDSLLNTLDGASTMFPTKRGLAFMNYQAFMQTQDQTLEFITDNIKVLWENFYNKSTTIKLIQMKYYLFITNGTKDILMFDFRTSSWWRWTSPIKVYELITDQEELKLISSLLYVFRDSNRYRDFPKTPNEKTIEWLISSQPLHMSLPNHYKNIKQLVFQLLDTSPDEQTITAQIKLYRKKVTITEPEIVSFNIDELRTFVKRFNYWKINELQWGLSNDEYTVLPAQLKLNGISVKYEVGEEVR